MGCNRRDLGLSREGVRLFFEVLLVAVPFGIAAPRLGWSDQALKPLCSTT